MPAMPGTDRPTEIKGGGRGAEWGQPSPDRMPNVAAAGHRQHRELDAQRVTKRGLWAESGSTNYAGTVHSGGAESGVGYPAWDTRKDLLIRSETEPMRPFRRPLRARVVRRGMPVAGRPGLFVVVAAVIHSSSCSHVNHPLRSSRGQSPNGDR